MRRLLPSLWIGACLIVSPGTHGDEPRPSPPGIAPGRAPAARLPVGNWTVEFTNGVVQACDILEFDGGHIRVDEPGRRAPGTAVLQDGSILMTYHDDRTERWTAIGDRFVVEHWFPSSRYPTGNPVLGIAERVR
jgi:hypothetical protein